ncbi:MAG: tyrosine-type recombinase/integrase [Candidatus Pacebacteria bacterium]|nr:tyrosine-type recombinase/integrase [Candidatus Paceibacterota bacterium]
MTQRKARITETTVTSRGKKYTRFVVVFYDETGNRKRKTFNRAAPAKKFAEQCDKDAARHEARQAMLKRRIGQDAEKLSPERLRDAVEALALLEGRGTLTDAVKCYLRELQRKAKNVPTVASLIDRYLRESEGEGLRPASLKELRVRLNKFAGTFGKQRIDEVERGAVQEWLSSLTNGGGKPLAHNTRKHYRYVIGGLFNHAIEHDLCSENPIAPKTRSRRRTQRRTESPTAEIFTPAQAKALLNAARDNVPEMIAPIAIGLFAGVRTAEIRRLNWSHIDLGRRVIKITGDIAKKRSVRNVSISDNLLKWLALAPDHTGAVAPETAGIWRLRKDKVLETAKGVQAWPYNAMRHSFGSYHLEQHGDPKKTALEMGHRDTGDLLFEHYRQLTTKEDAAKYWQIEPEQGAVLQYNAGVNAGEKAQ